MLYNYGRIYLGDWLIKKLWFTTMDVHTLASCILRCFALKLWTYIPGLLAYEEAMLYSHEHTYLGYLHVKKLCFTNMDVHTLDTCILRSYVLQPWTYILGYLHMKKKCFTTMNVLTLDTCILRCFALQLWTYIPWILVYYEALLYNYERTYLGYLHIKKLCFTTMDVQTLATCILRSYDLQPWTYIA